MFDTGFCGCDYTTRAPINQDTWWKQDRLSGQPRPMCIYTLYDSYSFVLIGVIAEYKLRLVCGCFILAVLE